jgi:hypothetical protein
MTTVIFTIGTQGQHDESFIGLLNKHAIDAVIDIRLRNEGRYYKFASGWHIRALVVAGGLVYRHELAFAPTPVMLKAYKDGSGWALYESAYRLLYDERAMSALWLAEYSRYARPCLLCAEIAPSHCHRRLLAEYLAMENGVQVVHLGGGKTHDNDSLGLS